jgi:Tfp pilus assembly protein PilN
MPSINLAPGTQYVIVARKRKIRLYAISLSVVVIFLIGGGGLFAYVQTLQSSSEQVKAEINAVDQKIEVLKDDARRVALFEKRLADTSQLLGNHVTWNTIFADLERLIPTDTIFLSLDASSESASVIVRGTTSNIDQVGLALASITKDVSHASVFESGTVKTIQRQVAQAGDGSTGSVQYIFDMTLKFAKSALNKATL